MKYVLIALALLSAPTAALAQGAPVNLLPNSQWEIASGLGFDAKMNVAGAGTMAPIAFSGYSTGANTVVVSVTGAMGDLKVGDLVTLRGAGLDAALSQSPMRVTAISPGVSFTIACPLNLAPSASVAGSALPVNIGMYAGSHATGDAFDGWSKTVPLVIWREDNAANLAPGATYALGVNKDSDDREYVATSALQVSRYRGRAISLGAYVYQKLRAGAGTWQLFVNSNLGVATSSPAAAADGYQWMEMTYAVPADATFIQVGVYFDGAAGDTYYVANPVLAFAPSIGVNNYAKPREVLAPINGVVPITWNSARIRFPRTQDNAPGYYDIKFDAYAETGGQIAPTVVNTEGQLEGLDAGVVRGATGAVRAIAFRNSPKAPIVVGGVMAQTVADVKSFATMNVTFGPDGYAWVNTGAPGDTWSNVAVEFDRFFLQ